jgi:hypothetical protein
MASYHEDLDRLAENFRNFRRYYQAVYEESLRTNHFGLGVDGIVAFNEFKTGAKAAYKLFCARLFLEHVNDDSKPEPAKLVEIVDEEEAAQQAEPSTTPTTMPSTTPTTKPSTTPKTIPSTTPPFTPAMPCFWCRTATGFDGHCLTECSAIVKVHPTRIALVLRAESRCTKCFEKCVYDGPNQHLSRTCTVKRFCAVCKSDNHHGLLHGAERTCKRL